MIRRFVLSLATIFVAGFLAVVGVGAAHADQPQAPYESCAYGETWGAWVNMGNLEPGADLSKPYPLQGQFKYRSAGIDFNLLGSALPTDWYPYVVTIPNGITGSGSSSFGASVDPTPAPFSSAGGLGPLYLAGATSSPNTKVTVAADGTTAIGNLYIHEWKNSDFSRGLWSPMSNKQSTQNLANAQTPKRQIVGVGIVYKPNFPGANDSFGEVRLPNGPVSEFFPGVYSGFVGVNDPSRCAFYYGEKLWNSPFPGITIDEPRAPIYDSNIFANNCYGWKQDYHAEWTHEEAVVRWDPAKDILVTSVLDYTQCLDDYTQLNTIRVNNISFCWEWPGGHNPGTDIADLPADFEGVDFKPTVFDQDQNHDIQFADWIRMDDDESLKACTLPYDMRTINDGAYGDLVNKWNPVGNGSSLGWGVNVKLRMNAAEDQNFPFTKDYEGIGTIPFWVVGEADSAEPVGDLYR